MNNENIPYTLDPAMPYGEPGQHAPKLTDKEFDEIVRRGYVPDPTKLFDSFRSHNRLHIAAMVMQGILANPLLMERYFAFGENEDKVARCALAYADALLAESQKGEAECSESMLQKMNDIADEIISKIEKGGK